MFSRLIPEDKFPEHFRNMSRDENRGFSQEYEVGLSKHEIYHRVYIRYERWALAIYISQDKWIYNGRFVASDVDTV